jgi:hypothetical protein
MGLSDITGVFSRYFVVGFFLPAYVGLVSLWLFASPGLVVPDALARHSEATELLILGGFALVTVRKPQSDRNRAAWSLEKVLPARRRQVAAHSDWERDQGLRATLECSLGPRRGNDLAPDRGIAQQ